MKSGPRRFLFVAPLVKLQAGRSSVHVLEIPERISHAVGRRGPVPIVATLNQTVEIQVSMVSTGGGRHRLQLNTRTRKELEIEPGDEVRVVLTVPDQPPRFPLPADLGQELEESDLQESFAALPEGKQNHIILWIEEAAHASTREKRVRMAIEVAFRARERTYERGNAAKTVRKPRN